MLQVRNIAPGCIRTVGVGDIYNAPLYNAAPQPSAPSAAPVKMHGCVLDISDPAVVYCSRTTS